MPPAEVTRRSVLLVASAILLVAALSFVGRGFSTVPDTLPAKLSDREFWGMVTDFSEDGGYFRSDNLLSNEAGYQQVIPVLRQNVRAGAVYLGVGPEQNFTYIAGLAPKMAFVVDIRRLNMLEHLLYKALMETSGDRPEFLSRLFSRPRPSKVDARSTATVLVDAYRGAEPSDALFEANLKSILDYLETSKGFELSTDDEAGVRHVYQAFFDSGPDLSYTFHGGYGGFAEMPTYGELMTEDDGRRNWSFLANEDQFHAVQRLQKSNLIVPLVGDFAGPKALRSVAEYLKAHNAFVGAFYTSNVEQYLFQDDDNWKRFYANVAALPVDASSMFIRYVLNGGFRFRSRSRAQWSPIDDVIRAYNYGRIRSYYDVVGMSR